MAFSLTATAGLADREGCRTEGSATGIMAPSWSSGAALLQGKRPRVRDSRPLGAEMDSSAFGLVCLKYCHNGGMASAYRHDVGRPGVRHGDDGPFPRSPEQAVMQGKVRRSVIRVLGGRDGLVCLTMTAHGRQGEGADPACPRRIRLTHASRRLARATPARNEPVSMRPTGIELGSSA
jgi:hypothetical protein